MSTGSEGRAAGLPAKLSMSGEFVAAAGAATVGMGERLRFYDALGSLGSASCMQLASATCMPAWLVEGWLEAQRAGGYIAMDSATGAYSLACALPESGGQLEKSSRKGVNTGGPPQTPIFPRS